MASKLFSYFFVKKENKSKCITLYGEQREVKIVSPRVKGPDNLIIQGKSLNSYFDFSFSLAPSYYCATRNFSRNRKGFLW